MYPDRKLAWMESFLDGLYVRKVKGRLENVDNSERKLQENVILTEEKVKKPIKVLRKTEQEMYAFAKKSCYLDFFYSRKKIIIVYKELEWGIPIHKFIIRRKLQ